MLQKQQKNSKQVAEDCCSKTAEVSLPEILAELFQSTLWVVQQTHTAEGRSEMTLLNPWWG